MTSYLSHLRNANIREKSRDATKANCFITFCTRKVRDYFYHWKYNAHKAETVIEVNETGPVVEEVLDHRIDVQNLKNYMKDQGYTEPEVEIISKQCMDRSKELMARAVARMKHYQEEDDLYLVPKMFDRWRFFVKMRKLTKHWLNYIENRL